MAVGWGPWESCQRYTVVSFAPK